MSRVDHTIGIVSPLEKRLGDACRRALAAKGEKA